jgi:uncharacterized membrane-anchored protein
VEPVSVTLFLAIGALVLVPLAREYVDFRRAWGLGRVGALATTSLVLPSLAVGFALALPLAAHPLLQWLATVLATIGIYSFAVRGVEQVVEPSAAPAPGSRR